MGATFWDQLSESDRGALLSEGVSRTLADGEYLFRQADPPTSAIVVVSGRLKLVRTAVSGKELLVEIRGTGDLVGELGVIDDRVRSAGAQAMGQVEVCLIESKRFSDMLADNARLSNAVLACLAHRMRESVDRRVQAGVGEVRYQLCGRLLELADDRDLAGPDPIEINSPLTQQEFADWIGVSRDAVVLAFQYLRNEAVVETGRRKIRILDIDRLTQLASRLD